MSDDNTDISNKGSIDTSLSIPVLSVLIITTLIEILGVTALPIWAVVTEHEGGWLGALDTIGEVIALCWGAFFVWAIFQPHN